MYGQEIFQVLKDLNHSDLGLCTGYEDSGRLILCNILNTIMQECAILAERFISNNKPRLILLDSFKTTQRLRCESIHEGILGVVFSAKKVKAKVLCKLHSKK